MDSCIRETCSAVLLALAHRPAAGALPPPSAWAQVALTAVWLRLAALVLLVAAWNAWLLRRLVPDWSGRDLAAFFLRWALALGVAGGGVYAFMRVWGS